MRMLSRNITWFGVLAVFILAGCEESPSTSSTLESAETEGLSDVVDGIESIDSGESTTGEGTQTSKPEADTAGAESSEEGGESSDSQGSNEDTTEPEADTTEPEADTTEPKADSSEPEADTSEPEADSSEPEADTTEPEEDTTEPEEDTCEETGCPDDFSCVEEDGTFSCVDVDECVSGEVVCDPGFVCVNQPGLTICEDINECDSEEVVCEAGATCVNTEGSFECACNSGYEKVDGSCADVDECPDEPLEQVCSELGVLCDDPDCYAAVNALDPYCDEDNWDQHCVACAASQPGYAGLDCSGVGDACVVGDEASSVCDLNAVCVNTPGSFECICNPGFEGDGTTCSDINECESESTCNINASCSNTPGSFYCTCNPTFAPDEGGGCSCPLGFAQEGDTCIDVNECEPGFEIEGNTCVDINECVVIPGVCGPNSTCENSTGSYVCTCKSGYLEIAGICEDIDECLNNPCSDGFSCVNFFGTFQCNDIDECATGEANCNLNYSTCENLAGSYQCVDIAECANNNGGCQALETCTEQSFSAPVCACDKPGTELTGELCTDIDECQTYEIIIDVICLQQDPISGQCLSEQEIKKEVTPCSDVSSPSFHSDDAVCLNQSPGFACAADECKPYFVKAGCLEWGPGWGNCIEDEYLMFNTCTEPTSLNYKSLISKCVNTVEGAECIMENPCEKYEKCTSNASGIAFDGNCGNNNLGYMMVDVCSDVHSSTYLADNAECIPSMTGADYICGCKDGYQGPGCEQIDLCADNNGGCGGEKDWKCENTLTAPYYQCLPKDECEPVFSPGWGFLLPGPCGTGGSSCTDNQFEDPVCTCLPGYQEDPNGPGCVDIDECTNGTAQCWKNTEFVDCPPGNPECLPANTTVYKVDDATCNNTGGSFECVCSPGTYGDGQNCTTCPKGHYCPGGNQLIGCPSGTYNMYGGAKSQAPQQVQQTECGDDGCELGCIFGPSSYTCSTQPVETGCRQCDQCKSGCVQNPFGDGEECIFNCGEALPMKECSSTANTVCLELKDVSGACD